MAPRAAWSAAALASDGVVLAFAVFAMAAQPDAQVFSGARTLEYARGAGSCVVLISGLALAVVGAAGAVVHVRIRTATRATRATTRP